MERMKKILALTMAMLILLSMIGCQKEPNRVAGGPESSTTCGHDHSETTAAAEETTGAAAQDSSAAADTQPEATGAETQPVDLPAVGTEPETQPETTEPTQQETQPAAPTEPEQTELEETEPATEPPTQPGHTHSYSKKVTNPTCSAKGYTTYTCNCGHSYKDDYTEKLDHSYQVKKVVEPTCTEEGYTLKKCSKCGSETQTDPVQASGHDYTEEVIDPTCTAKGYTLHTCEICGDSYQDNETAKTKHPMGCVEIVYPTVDSEGYEYYECKNGCGYTMTKTIPKLEEEIDVQALQDYGNQYGHEKYQFRIDTNCYAGYYPPSKVTLTSMDQAKREIEGKVDSLYRKLAATGDDPTGRARINVVLEHVEGNIYWLYAYYG